MSDLDQKPHVIFIPYPLQGHVIPAVHLAIKLASKGFTVTFVNTEEVHHRAARAHGADYSPFAGLGLDIRYRTVSDGLPVEFDRSVNHDEFMESVLHDLSRHVEDLVAEIMEREKSARPTCLIADTFFVWPSKVAEKFGLSYVSFWTEPALVFTLYYHLDLLRKNGHFDCQDIQDDPIDYIPGVSTINRKDLMSYLQDRDTTSVVHRIIFAAFADAKSADFVLCNTIKELEPITIQALQAIKPFYSVGPIFPGPVTTAPTSLWPESDCSKWLDDQPNGSVLYISFGSYAHVSRRDLAEIADGLARSKSRFIWVLRSDIAGDGAGDPLPVDFRRDSLRRGMIVPWCCQTAVLAHPAVGGFLTHCGWNSILESVRCQVPLLCFPLLTDQFTNRKLVVDDWKIGVSLGGQALVNGSDVAEKIVQLMGGELGLTCRIAIQEMKLILESALSPNGSSVKNLDNFITDLRNNMKK